MQCTQRLYLTEDKQKLVGEGDKKAAFLYAVPGDEIPDSAVEKFGLVDGHLKGFDPDKGADTKEDKSGSDKEDKSGSDKAGGDKQSGAGQAGAASGDAKA